MNRSAKAKLLNTDESSADYQQITKSVSQHLSSLLRSNHEQRCHQLILMRGAYFLKKKARIPIIKGFEQDYYLLSSSYLIAEISFNSVITDRWRVVRAF